MTATTHATTRDRISQPLGHVAERWRQNLTRLASDMGFWSGADGNRTHDPLLAKQCRRRPARSGAVRPSPARLALSAAFPLASRVSGVRLVLPGLRDLRRRGLALRSGDRGYWLRFWLRFRVLLPVASVRKRFVTGSTCGRRVRQELRVRVRGPYYSG